MLQSYIEGDPATMQYIHRHLLLLTALFEHPLFRFNWATQVKDGIIAACRSMFPHWWKKE